MEADRAAKWLKSFAEKSCRGQSPLYDHLCSSTADDDRLVEIVRAAPEGQPAPNLVLAAVHYLLLGGVEHELARYYASCAEAPLPSERSYSAFRAFCLEHEEEIRELVATRRVQTNEVGRCAYLLPAFSIISQQQPERPLAIIEVGTSAGLLLNWDRYAYDLGVGTRYGDLDATVQIKSEWRGLLPPLATKHPPKVNDRVGIDLHLVDVNDEQESRWLRSLVWPDQPERMKLIDAAIQQFRRTPADLLEGDAFDLLPAAIESLPTESIACVFHCHTLNQFSADRRQDFAAMLSECSKQRPISQLSAEWILTPQPELRWIQWKEGHPTETLLANVDHHGRWVEWCYLTQTQGH